MSRPRIFYYVTLGVLVVALPALVAMSFRLLIRKDPFSRPVLVETLGEEERGQELFEGWGRDEEGAQTPDELSEQEELEFLLSTAECPPPPESARVPVLVYHHVRPTPAGLPAGDRQYDVTPAQFDAQLAYLEKEGYTTIGIEELLYEFTPCGEPLPPKPVMITFDDGRESQYAHAFPLLAKRGMKAVFFVFTNAIGKPGYLTWDQMKEMREADMDFGSHTATHQFLTRLDDEALQRELAESRRVLQKELQTSIYAVAYPFGDVDDRVVAAAGDAGYIIGRGLEHRSVHAADGLLKIGSYIATGDLRAFAKIVRPEGDP